MKNKDRKEYLKKYYQENKDKNKAIDFILIFREESIEKFDKFQIENGLNNVSETLRFIIKKQYSEMKKKKDLKVDKYYKKT